MTEIRVYESEIQYGEDHWFAVRKLAVGDKLVVSTDRRGYDKLANDRIKRRLAAAGNGLGVFLAIRKLSGRVEATRVATRKEAV